MSMKKGFTLVELLAVIVILGIILAIAIPKIADIISNTEIEAHIKNEQMLKKAAESYMGTNYDELPVNIGDTVELTLDKLKTNKYITEIASPENNAIDCNGYVILTKVDKGEYSYTPHLNCESDIGSIAEDGLVLHYTFDDFQEPTENVVTNTNLDTGWSKGYQANIVFDEIDPPIGIDSPVVGFDCDDGIDYGYWYSYGDYAPQVPGQTYNVSLYVKTLDSNFRINFYTADNSEIGRYLSEYIKVPNDGNWHRIVWNSFVNAIDSQSNSLSFHFVYSGSGDNRTWLCAPQMEPKNHVTPFVDSEREGIIKDHSINGYHSTLTVIDSPEWVKESKIGRGAYNFNGSNACIKVSDAIETRFTNEDFSVAFWIKPESYSGNNRVISNGYYLDYGWEVFVDDNVTFRTYQDGVYQATLSSNLITINNWYYVVVTKESNNASIYINGDDKTITHDNHLDIIQYTGDLYIGKYTGGNSYSTDGYIDDVRIYKRVLLPEEIKLNYEKDKNNY